MLQLLEQYLTYKPNSEYYPELIPKDCTQVKITTELGEVVACYRFSESESFCINCHGNASNLSNLQPLYDFYDRLDQSFIAFDYPGYGASIGKPSEESLYASLDAVVDFVQRELKIPHQNIVLHGVSLGGAVAIEGLSKYQVKAGLIDATFTSNIGMAKYMFPCLPLWRLISSKFNSIEKIKKINTPILFVHGDNDQTVPAYMSEELYAAKPGGKELLIMSGVEHNDDLKTTHPEYLMKFKEFL